ncbi:MAG: hypothetical protein ACFFAQ_13000 [Promethearchaeota archaeon]
MQHTEVKNIRISIYFDLICGAISSSLALIAIVFTSIKFGIESKYLTGFIIALTFWILYLIFSLFMIFYGIYLYMQEIHFDDKKKIRKNLKPPIL